MPPGGLLLDVACGRGGYGIADPPLTALLEFRRVLASGARLVLSCWEAADPADERVSPRIRAVNLRRDLPAAGFVEVQVHEKPEWREVERRMWQEALAAPAGPDVGAPPVGRSPPRVRGWSSRDKA